MSLLDLVSRARAVILLSDGADEHADLLRELLTAEHALATPAVWWIVTLRIDGDDEDSLYVVAGADVDAAREAARQELIEDRYDAGAACASCGEQPCDETCGACDYPNPTVHVNHVVRCVGGAEPEHVVVAPM